MSPREASDVILESHRRIARSRDLLDRVARLLDEAERLALRSRVAGPELYRMAKRISGRRTERAMRSHLRQLHRHTDAVRLRVH